MISGVGIVRRLWAFAALVSLAAAAGLAVALAVDRFPRGLAAFACLLLAVLAAWRALLADGLVKRLYGISAVLALGGAFALVVLEGGVLGNVLVIVLFALSIPASREDTLAASGERVEVGGHTPS